MNFEDKIKEIAALSSGEPTLLTIDTLSEKLSDDEELTIELFHGSNSFTGDKFELDKVGSRTGQVNDARGTGIYCTDVKSVAQGYAGSKGQLITAELTLNRENISNLVSPFDYEELIERAVLEAGGAFEFFSNNFETNPSVPFYDPEDGEYECPETGETIEMDLDKFVEKFGGLKHIFTEPYFRSFSHPQATNPVDDFILSSLDEETLFDALLNIESELYSPNIADDYNRVRAAIPLNELKAEYDIKCGVFSEAEEGLVFIVNDTDSMSITNINDYSMKPVKPKPPKM